LIAFVNRVRGSYELKGGGRLVPLKAGEAVQWTLRPV
jgi:hypothetical protein